jgi:hypothetical protein
MDSITNSNRAHLNLTSFQGCERNRCFSPVHSSNESDVYPEVVLTPASAMARTE